MTGRAGGEARGTAGVDGAFVAWITLAVGGTSFAVPGVGVLISFDAIAPFAVFGGVFAFTKRCSFGS